MNMFKLRIRNGSMPILVCFKFIRSQQTIRMHPPGANCVAKPKKSADELHPRRSIALFNQLAPFSRQCRSQELVTSASLAGMKLPRHEAGAQRAPNMLATRSREGCMAASNITHTYTISCKTAGHRDSRLGTKTLQVCIKCGVADFVDDNIESNPDASGERFEKYLIMQTSMIECHP